MTVNPKMASRDPQPPEANGGSGAEPPTAEAIFTVFPKMRSFKHTLA